jgi:predicted RNase H-like HicB family nuclease
MSNEFTGVFEKDGDWYIAHCPEVPGANGQGKTIDECRESLVEAIRLILDERRAQGLVGVPPDAVTETVTVR